MRKIRKAIKTKLIQQRAVLKSRLVKSVELDLRIDRTARLVFEKFGVHDMEPSAKVWARYALMRSLLVDMGKDSRQFWDTVDEVLDSIREDSARDGTTVNQLLKKYLDQDQATYRKDAPPPSSLNQAALTAPAIG